MRPEEYLRIAARRWWLIPLIALTAAAVAFLYTDRQPRVYMSNSEIIAIAQPPEYFLDLYAKNRLASYKKLVASGPLAQRAVERGNLGIDAGTLLSKLAVAHNPDTNTVQIAASDSDPQRAAAIVNAVAEAFIERNEADNAALVQAQRDEERRAREDLERQGVANATVSVAKVGIVRMEQLGRAGPAAVPSAPRPKLNAAAAAILGAALALVLAFVLEYLDDTLRTAEDVRRHLDLPTIAGIPGGAAAVRRRPSARSGGSGAG